MRVAFFTDTFREINGVALTSRQLTAYAQRRGYPFLCVRGADENSIVTVTGSSASNNAGVGFISQSTVAATQSVMSLFNSTSSVNGVGVQAGGGAGSGFLKIGNNAIYQNSAGIVVGANGNCATFQQGGQGTNYNDGSGTCTPGTIATQ